MLRAIFKKKKKIGIALSGGAARAFSHIGVLKVLEELGVDIAAVSGASMGSVIGAFYCSGITLEEIEAYVRSMDWKSFLLFSNLSLSKTGIINWRRVEEELKKFLGDKTFSDCRIKLCCVAVDLIRGEKVVLSKGRLLDAVRASIAIPAFFSPVCINDYVLVDGGVIEPLPTDSLKKMGGVDFIIASSIKNENTRNKLKDLKNSDTQDRQNKNRLSIRNVLDISLSIMQREMTRHYLDIADIVIEPEVGDFGFFDLTRGGAIIRRGVEAARNKIPEIKRKLGL
jgi:NTE family protein